jgi:hypothetical protein
MTSIINAINLCESNFTPKTYTENGATAFETTGSHCLDLFFKLHRPKRKMGQNTVMSCKFYNYVSGNFVGGTS